MDAVIKMLLTFTFVVDKALLKDAEEVELFFLAPDLDGVLYCRSSSHSFRKADVKEVEGAELAARSLPCSGLKCSIINQGELSMMNGCGDKNATDFTFVVDKALLEAAEEVESFLLAPDLDGVRSLPCSGLKCSIINQGELYMMNRCGDKNAIDFTFVVDKALLEAAEEVESFLLAPDLDGVRSLPCSGLKCSIINQGELYMMNRCGDKNAIDFHLCSGKGLARGCGRGGILLLRSTVGSGRGLVHGRRLLYPIRIVSGGISGGGQLHGNPICMDRALIHGSRSLCPVSSESLLTVHGGVCVLGGRLLCCVPVRNGSGQLHGNPICMDRGLVYGIRSLCLVSNESLLTVHGGV